MRLHLRARTSSTARPGGATMSSSKLDFRWLTVLKDYPEKEHERWEREVWAYQNLSWATPKLDGFNPRWIEMERLVPILDLPYDVARKYRDPLRELLVADRKSTRLNS